VFAVCQGALATARMTGNVADFEASLSALKGLYTHWNAVRRRFLL